jgi:dihydrofolate synthase / folylpolyglutamate synthase
MTNQGETRRDYQETLQYLFGLQRFGIKLGLANITALLQYMEQPQEEFPAVHIAGSNGKGSTASFLASILQQAGYRVGLYTSPHLIDFNERIQINGLPIPTDRVVFLTEYIQEAIDRMKKKHGGEQNPIRTSGDKDFDPKKAVITFFEFTTAMAFLHFRQEKIDIAVLEAGMGGRLDATNVIDPLLSVITTISLEHTQYLGESLLKIAGEKAGIIKPKRPLLTSASQPEVLDVFRQRCQELQSPCYSWKNDFSAVELCPQVISFQGRSHQWEKLHLGMAGRHQMINASLALAAVETLMEDGFAFEEKHLRQGLAEVKWPGRLEQIGGKPAILLDGAHNPEAAEVLREALTNGFPRHRLILVMGIMVDKEIGKMMASLVPLADFLILTQPGIDRAAPLDILRTRAASFGKPTVEIGNVAQAVAKAMQEAKKEDLILVTGSLYTVGEARAFLKERGLILH